MQRFLHADNMMWSLYFNERHFSHFFPWDFAPSPHATGRPSEVLQVLILSSLPEIKSDV